MTAVQFRNLLMRRWWFVVVCTVCAGLGAFLGTRLLTPLYQSTVVMQVDIGSAYNVYALAAGDRLIGTYDQLVTSTSLLDGVAANWNDLSAARLKSEITTTPQPNSLLFDISVEDASATRAAALANAIANALINKVQLDTEQVNTQAQQPFEDEMQATQSQMNVILAQLTSAGQNPADAGQIAALNAQLSGLQQQYGKQQDSFEHLLATESLNAIGLRVVEPALPSSPPVRPVYLANVSVGLLFGLLLGVLLIVMGERRGERVPMAGVVAEVLGSPVLAEIAGSSPIRGQNGVAQAHQPGSADPYQALQTALEFLSVERPLRSLVVASADATEGASAVAADLALAVATEGKRVLLVDANLHHPSQADRFGVPSNQGLSNAILAFKQPNQAAPPLFQFVQPAGGTALPTLMVMPAGTPAPNPTELLKSSAMAHLYKAMLGSGVDVLVFDAPAVVGPLDARILAANTDGILVVVDRRRARRVRLERVRTLLATAGAQVLGCVIVDASQVQPLDASRARRHGTERSTNTSVQVQRAGTAGPLIAVPLPDDSALPIPSSNDATPGFGGVTGRDSSGQAAPYA